MMTHAPDCLQELAEQMGHVDKYPPGQFCNCQQEDAMTYPDGDQDPRDAAERLFAALVGEVR
jgi:hypothetical protein